MPIFLTIMFCAREWVGLRGGVVRVKEMNRYRDMRGGVKLMDKYIAC